MDWIQWYTVLLAALNVTGSVIDDRPPGKRLTTLVVVAASNLPVIGRIYGWW